MFPAYHLGCGQLVGRHFALLLYLLHQVQYLPTFLLFFRPLPHPAAKLIRLVWAGGAIGYLRLLRRSPLFNPFKTTFAD